MSLFFTARTEEGVALVGCQTKDPELQEQVALRINLLAPDYVEFSQTGWVLARVASDFPPEALDARIKHGERVCTAMPPEVLDAHIEIDDKGIVTPEMAAGILGPTAARAVFPHAELFLKDVA